MPKIYNEQLQKWAPLGAAGVLGLAAAGLGWFAVAPAPQSASAFVAHGPAAGGAAVEFDSLVVAARPLASGEELKPDDLKLMRVEKGSRPATAFGSVKALVASARRAAAAKGTVEQAMRTSPVLTQDVVAGEAIMAHHLAPADTPPGIAAMLPKGYRAMTIEAKADAALEGLLKPGARVDVVASLRDGSVPIARTIVQDVLVLAVGGSVVGDKPAATVDDEAETMDEGAGRSGTGVTLVVTPEQAARIDLAYTSGKPRLVLRGGGDRDLSRFEGLTLAQLLGMRPGATDAASDGSYADAGETTETDGGLFDGFGEMFGGRQPAGPAAAGVDTGEIGSNEPAPAEGMFSPNEPKDDGVEAAPAKPKPAPARPRIVEILRGHEATRVAVPVPAEAAAPTPPAE